MNSINQEAVLKMVADGKITPEEGAKLLAALTENDNTEKLTPAMERFDNRDFTKPAATPGKGKFLRVIVNGQDNKNDEIDVDVNLPLKLAKNITPMLEKMIPEDAQSKMDESGFDMAMLAAMLETLDEDMEGRDLVNVFVKEKDNENGGESAGIKVRIYVE